MIIQFQCPCGKSYNVPDNLAGKHAKCSNCGGILIVPPADSLDAQIAQRLISLNCVCGKSFNIKESLSGKKIRCACGNVLRVPAFNAPDNLSEAFDSEITAPNPFESSLTESNLAVKKEASPDGRIAKLLMLITISALIIGLSLLFALKGSNKHEAPAQSSKPLESQNKAFVSDNKPEPTVNIKINQPDNLPQPSALGNKISEDSPLKSANKPAEASESVEKKTENSAEKIDSSPKKDEFSKSPLLRNKALSLTEDEFSALLKKYNFYDSRKNKKGGFENDFADNGNSTVTDMATGLMWQKGSSSGMYWNDVNNYLDKLNKDKFAGYSDWRLPTMPELASLVSKSKNENGFYLDPIFQQKQGIYCSADTCSYNNAEMPWYVSFIIAVSNCDKYNVVKQYSVKAVRSIDMQVHNLIIKKTEE